jgi:hypothetical protein
LHCFTDSNIVQAKLKSSAPNSRFVPKVSIRLMRQLGHARWRLENNAWCDLTKRWALKHGFLHACKHRPQRRDAQGQLQPLPNHGLPAVTLILCIAFVLCSALPPQFVEAPSPKTVSDLRIR